jgi:FkbM family methyltransferase
MRIGNYDCRPTLKSLSAKRSLRRYDKAFLAIAPHRFCMRKYFNALLSPLGYELRRIDRFAKRLDELLQSPAGVKFVQIGASDGVRFDDLYGKVTSHRCAGLVVEPLPDMYERLKLNYADYPNVVPVRVAVHATATSLQIYRVARNDAQDLPDWVAGVASFDREHLLKHGIPENLIVTQPVDCQQFMPLLSQHGFLDANVLQIDVEGYDAEVLRMIDFARFRPRLIKYEHKNLILSEAREATRLLREAGYYLSDQRQDTIAWRRT